MSEKQAHKNASEFIRSMPAAMKASEVVEKAKEANWDIGEGLVYQVRAVDRKKNGAPSRGKGLKRITSRAMPLAGSKSDFVRAQPASMTAAEIIAKAKAAKMTLTSSLVYAVRGRKTSKVERHRGGPQKKVGGRRTAGGTPVPAGGTELSFRKLAFDLGINRSRELLNELEQRLREIVEG
jgi:hypothetical protein